MAADRAGRRVGGLAGRPLREPGRLRQRIRAGNGCAPRRASARVLASAARRRRGWLGAAARSCCAGGEAAGGRTAGDVPLRGTGMRAGRRGPRPRAGARHASAGCFDRLARGRCRAVRAGGSDPRRDLLCAPRGDTRRDAVHRRGSAERQQSPDSCRGRTWLRDHQQALGHSRDRPGSTGQPVRRAPNERRRDRRRRALAGPCLRSRPRSHVPRDAHRIEPGGRRSSGGPLVAAGSRRSSARHRDLLRSAEFPGRSRPADSGPAGDSALAPACALAPGGTATARRSGQPPRSRTPGRPWRPCGRGRRAGIAGPAAPAALHARPVGSRLLPRALRDGAAGLGEPRQRRAPARGTGRRAALACLPHDLGIRWPVRAVHRLRARHRSVRDSAGGARDGGRARLADRVAG